MSAILEKLTFDFNLQDRVTGPIGKIQNKLTTMADSAQSAFMQVGMGGAAVAGAGFALDALTAPAREMSKAMGEVASLGVANDVLAGLGDEALKFSTKYGASASEFTRSAYDIQSAIAGLEGNELAAFTNASNVLAKGTKADAGTITSYMGTMYGIFKNKADAMGKAEWVEQLSGQTATAVQMFKTTGMEMSAAFTSVGANATAAGIDAAEQMAILGQLQSTMSGSEAGTKYKAFLAGVGQAQEKLGLSFTDAEGNMLGMVDILGKIKGKFGSLKALEDSDALKKAFGSDEASSLIKLLLADSEGLAKNIATLDSVQGMEKAQEMAQKMVDPMDRFNSGVTAMRIGFGQALLPVINPVIDSLADGAAVLTRWTKEFPTVTKWIGYGVLTILSITAAMGAFTMAAGLARVVMIGWQASMLLVSGVMKLLRGVMAVFRIAILATNAAMWANPVSIIVGLLVGLMAVIGAVIYWWDDLKAAFLDSSWGKGFMKVVESVVGWFKNLGGMVEWVLDKLSYLPGFGGDSDAAEPKKAAPAPPRALEAPTQSAVPAGGLTKSITKTVASSSSQSTAMHVGTVNINYAGDMDPQELRELLLMEVG